MPKKKSAKQLDRDIADALAIAQVREQFGRAIADVLDREKGRYVSVAWTYDAAVVADPDRRYREASYAKTDMPTLLASLRKHGVHRLAVNDREVSL